MAAARWQRQRAGGGVVSAAAVTVLAARYGRDKLLARAIINLIAAGWRSSGLPAWESIVFIYHTPCSLAPHMTPLLAFGARARTT